MIGLIVLLFSAPILLGVLVANAIVLLFWVLKVALEIIVFFIDAAADSETSDRLHRKTNAFLPAWLL